MWNLSFPYGSYFLCSDFRVRNFPVPHMAMKQSGGTDPFLTVNFGDEFEALPAGLGGWELSFRRFQFKEYFAMLRIFLNFIPNLLRLTVAKLDFFPTF